MDTASKSGQMEPATKVIGRTIEPMASESSPISTVMCTRATGLTIRPTARASISMSMAHAMKASGWTTSSMVTVKNNGQTAQSTKENT